MSYIYRHQSGLGKAAASGEDSWLDSNPTKCLSTLDDLEGTAVRLYKEARRVETSRYNIGCKVAPSIALAAMSVLAVLMADKFDVRA